MSPACIDRDPALAEETATCGDRVARTAFYFQSEGQSLFAWLHRSRGSTVNHGVVICAPIGHEQVHSHRTLRSLADRLAAHGFAVLRFDYHGTGDSDGSDRDPHRVATWLANVRDAVGWLRDTSGCQKITLVGLRMGATLAALYTGAHDIDNLVLWSPIVKGRRYVRELTALSLTATHSADLETSSIEAAGFIFTRETIQALSRIDVTTVTPRCRHVLIMNSETGPEASRLFDHFFAQGAKVAQLTFDGYDAMMAEPHQTTIPHGALRSIANWLVSKGTTPAWHELPVNPANLVAATSMLGAGAIILRESIHRISASPDLFGIMTRQDGIATKLPWIVMLNAGAAYRIGPGRLHVQLARQFAARGYPSLRIDLCGLGDSVIDDPARENDSYAATAFRDVALVCDYLQQLEPGRSMVLMGLCSGAYAAFQSAARLPHRALIESILINPLTFFWREGMKIDDSSAGKFRAWHYYRTIMCDPKSWRKLLTGKTKTGFTGSLRRFVRAVMIRSFSFARRFEGGRASGPGDEHAHHAEENLAGDLARVAAASRNLAMFVAESDPGYYLLMCQARRKAKQLIRAGMLRCVFIGDADHTFSTERSRDALSRSIADYLQRRYGSSSGNEVDAAGGRSLKSHP